MTARVSTIGIQDRPGQWLPAGPLSERIADVTAGHEAQLLALRLGRRDEPQVGRDGAHLGLGQVAQREAAVGELVLAQAVQEVALVLVRVDAASRSWRMPVGRAASGTERTRA